MNKIVAIQVNHPSKLNPVTDTSIFLANEIQKKGYKIFYYEPRFLSIVKCFSITSAPNATAAKATSIPRV